MKQTLIFKLHKSKVLNSNKKLHYHAHGKIVKILRQLSKDMGEESREKEEIFFDKFKISVTVCPPTRRRLDPPNLYPTVKAIIDGLTDAEWWEDDNFKYLLELSFRYGGLSGESDTFVFKVNVEEINDIENYILESEVAI